MAIDKNKKELAMLVLEEAGIDHDQWLEEKYVDVVFDSSKLIKDKFKLASKQSQNLNYSNQNK
ncbi:Uncharacterised protein [[Clostridium] sordellii]|uniref:hypothetical protein n=1 Tax=Paraclostridium sordellii TaxID=1505 RepID=UPI0005DB20AC|nr:hypothetical protein [Paeniclostridium sordellii]MCJ8342815.1 hypothetical protein [Cetobacterium sp.]CEP45718.1 Uncharacterised protein [[Clostridium] sordellii] [Paeniclostridium sordellii]